MPKRILVVEDDNVLNRLLVGQLRDQGYDVTGVMNWRDGER